MPQPPGNRDRLAAQVTARIRHLLDTCPACAARAEAQATTPRLSPRRREVLALAAQGLTIEQIAHRLTISVPTVRTTLAVTRHKLGARSTTEAVAIAVRGGLIE